MEDPARPVGCDAKQLEFSFKKNPKGKKNINYVYYFKKSRGR